MPCAYHIDTERGVVFIRAWGVLRDQEVTATGRALRADSRFDPEYTRLENLVEVTEFSLSTALVQSVARMHEMSPPPRRAFVVGSDLAFGMIRMLELYANASPTTFLVCRDLAEGFRWVGLPPTDRWPEEHLREAQESTDGPPSKASDTADD